MFLIEKLTELLLNPEYSLFGGFLSIIIGYIVYQQHQMRRILDDRWNQLQSMLKENKYRHNDIVEDISYMREMIKEETNPDIRDLQKEMQKLDDIYKLVQETKLDQKDWNASVHDDINQFRSEFRDILKLVLNGKKNNNNCS